MNFIIYSTVSRKLYKNTNNIIRHLPTVKQNNFNYLLTIYYFNLTFNTIDILSWKKLCSVQYSICMHNWPLDPAAYGSWPSIRSKKRSMCRTCNYRILIFLMT